MFRSAKMFLAMIAASSVASGGAAWANNVQVALEGSLMTVFGDNASNSIVIEQRPTGIVVYGRAGTTVNRAPSVAFPGVALNAMEVRMEGGDDKVTLDGLEVANDLYISLGSGVDRLDTMAGIGVGANFFVEAGAGNDSVVLGAGSIAEDATIDGGLGSLTATLSNMDFGKNLTIISDAAADTISVMDVLVAEFVSIESKAGNDSISIGRGASLGVFTNSDAGADRVSISSWLALEDVGVFTGIGNDQVSLSALSIGKSITVSVDAGNDSVIGTNVTATEDAVFEGGAGTDTITDRGIVGRKKKEIKEFERVLR